MPYTDDVEGARRWTKGPTGTLQIFSFKVVAIAKELRWPLEVYGLIAIRDYVDKRLRGSQTQYHLCSIEG
jgi:hypothetical protein